MVVSKAGLQMCRIGFLVMISNQFAKHWLLLNWRWYPIPVSLECRVGILMRILSNYSFLFSKMKVRCLDLFSLILFVLQMCAND